MKILQALHLANQIAGGIFAEMAGDGGKSTRTQALVLLHLAAHPGSSQVAITAATSVDRSTLADVMRRLHKRGLVRRVRSRADRRAWVCELTVAGVTTALELKKVAEDAEVRLVELIPSVAKLNIPKSAIEAMKAA